MTILESSPRRASSNYFAFKPLRGWFDMPVELCCQLYYGIPFIDRNKDPLEKRKGARGRPGEGDRTAIHHTETAVW
jgi:hypothetical protein